MAKIREGLETIKLKTLENKHLNFKYKFKNRRSYKLFNPKNKIKQLDRYNATTKNIQHIIKLSLLNGERVRPLGGNWSFTKVGYARDRIIDTKSLRLKFKVDPSHLHRDCAYDASDLFLLQSGNSIMDINAHLEGRNRQIKKSIMASGASNGQTIAGAISTNTHGSAFNFGSVHDAVVGLHIVTGPDSSVFIQKKSDKVITPFFANLFNAFLIEDDDIFNAAVVSFGSFGFIHGIMLRTEPIFLLEKYRIKVPLNNALRNAMDTFDFSNLNLPTPRDPNNSELYHVGLVVNPYNLDNNKKGVYFTTLYKIPFDPNHKKKTLKDRGYTYGDDTLGVINGMIKLLQVFQRGVIKGLVNLLIGMQYPDDEKFPWLGTMGEHFNYTSLRGKAASMAIGVSRANASKSLDILIDLIENKKPFPGVIGIRFVKGTKAVLGFTSFADSCVIELDGVDSDIAHDFYRLLWKTLKNKNIPFTLHWGKINHHLNKSNLKKMYGSAKINKWLQARADVLQREDVAEVFTNEFMEKCGLDKWKTPSPPAPIIT